MFIEFDEKGLDLRYYEILDYYICVYFSVVFTRLP